MRYRKLKKHHLQRLQLLLYCSYSTSTDVTVFQNGRYICFWYGDTNNRNEKKRKTSDQLQEYIRHFQTFVTLWMCGNLHNNPYPKRCDGQGEIVKSIRIRRQTNDIYRLPEWYGNNSVCYLAFSSSKQELNIYSNINKHKCFVQKCCW